MAEIGGAVVGGAAGIAAAAYTNYSSFSARHDQWHDSLATLTQSLAECFEKAYLDSDIDDEEYDKYLEIKNTAIESAKEYLDSIQAYKKTGILKFLKKRSKKKEVRKKKEQTRSASENLRDHYYESSWKRAYASSTTAVSGSPPCSAIKEQNIQDWAEDVEDLVDNQYMPDHSLCPSLLL